jgi:hypothetical protein
MKCKNVARLGLTGEAEKRTKMKYLGKQAFQMCKTTDINLLIVGMK